MTIPRTGRAAWLSRGAGAAPRLEVHSDQARAPLSFGWWARTAQDRVSKYFHVETIYRLDRQPGGGHTTNLVPSSMYGMTQKLAAEYLLVRQCAFLRRLPADYSWVGPVLIEDVVGEPRVIEEPFYSRLLPGERRAKLETASALAQAILQRPQWLQRSA